MAVGVASQKSFIQRSLLQLSWLIWAGTIFSLMPNLCHTYDSSLGLSKLCKGRCDNHRRFGWRGEYKLDCNKEYPDYASQKYCREECTECPVSICDRYEPNIFHCPSTDIEDHKECKARCDSNREKGSLDGYVLKCDQAYFYSSDIRKCQDECGVCPQWVCNPNEDSNVYYCPTGNYKGQCKTDCEYHRHNRFHGTPGKFSFDCTDFYDLGQDAVDNCRRACKNCPLMICNENEDRDEYTCPSIYDPKPNPTGETTTTTTTTTTPKPEPKYEGRCKQRCDKYRLGCTKSYSFYCDSLFSTSEEENKCIEDCKHCPKDVCKSPEFGASRAHFKCPVSDNHREPSPAPSPPYNSSRSSSSDATIFLILVIYAIFISLLLIIVTIMYCRKGNNAGVVPAGPVLGMPLTSQGMYQPQQQPVYAVSQPSNTSISSPTPTGTSASNASMYYK